VLAFDDAAKTWSTRAFAGDGTAGHADGAGGQARFNRPCGLAVDAQGNLYVADSENHRIRKVAPDGTVSTLAGDGTAGWQDGAGAQARFNKPQGLLVDGSGTVYVADTENHRIRRILADGTVSTVAGDGTAGFRDGASGQARFKGPTGLLADGSGGLVVADEQNHRLRLLAGSTVSTLAGDGDGTGLWQDGPALESGLSKPCALAPDGSGGFLVAAGTLRRVKDGQIGSLVGTFTSTGATVDGSFKDATFGGIRGVLGFQGGGALVIDRHEVRTVKWP
jgi:DNA-binding beta-propeller fold protein YncE